MRPAAGLLSVAVLLGACTGGVGPTPPTGSASPSSRVSPMATPRPSVADDLAALSDEFDDPSTLPDWTRLDGINGWPDQLQRIDIGETNPGELFLQPWASAWYADFRAAMLYKEVTGDFVLTARSWGAGNSSDVPRRSFSLVGLVARADTRDTPGTWQPGNENYVFITTGTGDLPGQPQIETKTTTDSESVLTLKGGRRGWVDLRVVRVGSAFLMLFRPAESAEWRISDRFSRPDLPDTLQLGVLAYTDWQDLVDYHARPEELNRTQITGRHPDLLARVDYVRFARPMLPTELEGRDLSNEEISAATILAVFGGADG